ncbi:MAG: fibronectin type III domain-containing protein [Syntrophorhabdaceae bacterium]
MRKRSIWVFSILCLFLLAGLVLLSCGKKGNPVPMAVVKAGVIADLKAEAKDGMVFLSFTPLAALTPDKKGENGPKITGYRIAKGCGTCLGDLRPLRTIILDEGRGYTIAGGRIFFYDDDIIPGNEYAYTVYPLTAMGTRGEGSNTAVILWKQPPVPPAQVKVAEGDSRVEISWTKDEGYLYNIYRYDDGIYPIFPLNPRPVSGALHMDAGLTNGKTYVYEVRRVKESEPAIEGEGTKATAVPRDKTAPGIPIALKAKKEGKAIVLTFEANTEPDFAGYNIYRIMGSQAQKVNTEPVKENKFIDRNPPDYRFVAYHVTAVDKAGNESSPSQEAVVLMKE